MSARSIQDSLHFVSQSPDFVALTPGPSLKVDLRYATTNNFLQQKLYGSFDAAFLHKLAAHKLTHAVGQLELWHKGYALLVYDALRPRSVQQLMWNAVRGTEKEKYVANPESGSVHNYGFAVDVSLLDPEGKELDMGTSYDDFSPVSEPRYEEEYIKSGVLTSQQVANRHLLRDIMTKAAFIPLALEWWHFDALAKNEVRQNYSIVE